MKIKTKVDRRVRIHLRQRKRIAGTKERPRLSVFRSVSHIYAQVIDDMSGQTLASASSIEPELKGVFDFTLEWTPDEGQAVPRPDSAERPASAPGPSIFSAIQEQLGLRLEARKGPVAVLVIDHAEKVPVEN